MTNFILISGQRFAGKDTVADSFVERYGYTKMCLADALKEHTASLFGFPVQWCYTREGKNKLVPNTFGLTVGEVLVSEGTRIRNTYHPEFWCRKLLDRIARLGVQDVVIPDCRFENEYRFFKNISDSQEFPQCADHAFCFVLERPDAGAVAESAGDKRDPNDESETGWRNILERFGDSRFVSHILNNGTLEELRSNVDDEYCAMVEFHNGYY